MEIRSARREDVEAIVRMPAVADDGGEAGFVPSHTGFELRLRPQDGTAARTFDTAA